MLFESLQAHFQQAGWPLVQVPDHPVLSITYGGESGQWVFVATVDEDTRTVTMFSRCPETCPPERFAALCEFMARANYGMLYGCFDLDFSDGEVRFRVGADLAGRELDWNLFRSMAFYDLMTMDTYLPALLEVIRGEASAEEAYASVDV